MSFKTVQKLYLLIYNSRTCNDDDDDDEGLGCDTGAEGLTTVSCSNRRRICSFCWWSLLLSCCCARCSSFCRRRNSLSSWRLQQRDEAAVTRPVTGVKRTTAKRSEGSPGEGPRSYLRNLISSFLVSLSVMIFDVVTLTSTPSTMNLRVFFSVFL